MRSISGAEQTRPVADASVVSLLTLPTEILLSIIHLAAATPLSATQVDLPTLVQIAQTCSHLRHIVLTHVFQIQNQGIICSGGLASTLRAHAISNAWATGQLHRDPSLQLTTANLDLPNATGLRAQHVRPIVLRLPRLRPQGGHQEGSSGHEDDDVHILLLFRAQALYWAKTRRVPRKATRRDGSIYDEARWEPSDATPLTVIGRPVVPPVEAQQRFTASTSHSTRGSNRTKPSKVQRTQASDSYGTLGRIANLSLDPTSLTGADNPYQDITSAIVLPLSSADGSITIVMGRRDGTSQLATLSPPSLSPTQTVASQGSARLILHPVLPFRFSNDIQALHAVRLPKQAPSPSSSSSYAHQLPPSALLAVGTKSGHIAVMRVYTQRSSQPTRADGKASGRSVPTCQQTSPSGSRTTAPSQANPMDKEAPQAAVPKSVQSKGRRSWKERRELLKAEQSGVGPSHQGPIADPQGQRNTRAWKDTPSPNTAPDTAPYVELLIHRDLSHDLAEAEAAAVNPSGAEMKKKTANMTVWSLRFLGDFSSRRRRRRTSASSSSSTWLAVGCTGTEPLMIYSLNIPKTPHEGDSSIKDADGASPKADSILSSPICLPHPCYLSADSGRIDAKAVNQPASNPSPSPSLALSTVAVAARTGAVAVPAPSSSTAPPPARSKSSVYALFALPFPPSLERVWRTSPTRQQGSADAGTSSSSPPADSQNPLSILVVGYFDGTVALFAIVGDHDEKLGDSEETSGEKGGRRAASSGGMPRLLMRLEDPSTQDAVYSLRAFWHLPTINGPTVRERDGSTSSSSATSTTTPVLRVLAGSARFGCVRVWEVSGDELVATLPGGSGGKGDDGGSLYSGMTLFPSFPWRTSIRTRTRGRRSSFDDPSGPGGEDDEQGGKGSMVGAPRRPAFLLPSTQQGTPSTNKVGPTYSLALDVDDECGQYDDDDDAEPGMLGRRRGARRMDANAGGRVWGTNGWGVWMLDFVPTLASSVVVGSAEEEEEEQHMVGQVAYYVHDGVRMDLRLSVDPWE
ncbi:unnamed protein product [Tilletia caries]|uniref:F-box domain-containing protein n=2 Tax=Tilletia TaxID=13289 RepID=A0A8X7N138_9BASI|nr:hypothetical protein CF336_g215 [Tilletia laevis]KAE8205854.1 hypothetical protein CF328_g238 [Tilletia controversa]KAE8264159.1 hypothetical protein A4X03_0g1143 [Tilletia caries]KAE8208911.1 hypothetical protein CF335_g50 [Tilletia laevis]KAE8255966.1 hypothetical protein A4X06_0g144 [Tilletia controversa]